MDNSQSSTQVSSSNSSDILESTNQDSQFVSRDYSFGFIFPDQEFIETDHPTIRADPGLQYVKIRVSHYARITIPKKTKVRKPGWVIRVQSKCGSIWTIVRLDESFIKLFEYLKGAVDSSVFSAAKIPMLRPFSTYRPPNPPTTEADLSLRTRAAKLQYFLEQVIKAFPRHQYPLLQGFLEIGGKLIPQSPPDYRFLPNTDFLTENPHLKADPGALVMVTGANGWLGGHCVKALLQRGYRVRGTVRDPTNMNKVGYLKKLPGADQRLELVKCSLQNLESFQNAMSGVKYVLHTASPVKDSSPDPINEIIRPALHGALNVLQAVTTHGESVTHVIFTSSVAAVHHRGEKDRGIKQFSRYHWNKESSVEIYQYYYSKTLAEKASWDFWIAMKKSVDPDFELDPDLIKQLKDAPNVPKEYLPNFSSKSQSQTSNSSSHPSKSSSYEFGPYRKFKLVTILPSMIWGPVLHSKGLSLSTQSILDIVNAKYPGLPPVGFGAVDVRDCASAHIAAFENPRSFGRHILDNGSVWMLEVCKMLSFHYHWFNVPTRSIPKGLILLAVYFDPKMNSKNMRAQMSQIPEFDHSETISPRLFGRRLTPLPKTLFDMVESFIDMKLTNRGSQYRLQFNLDDKYSTKVIPVTDI